MNNLRKIILPAVLAVLGVTASAEQAISMEENLPFQQTPMFWLAAEDETAITPFFTIGDSGARLTRFEDGLKMEINTSGLPNGAYTHWWLIFNNSLNCEVPGICTPQDVASPAVETSEMWGAGVIVNDGTMSAESIVRVGEAQGEVPFGNGLTNPEDALIVYVLKWHGPVSDDPEVRRGQLNYSRDPYCETRPEPGPTGFGYCPNVQMSFVSPLQALVQTLQQGKGGYYGTQDSFVSENKPNKTAGNKGLTYVKSSDSRKEKVSLFKWDTAGIPANSLIESATISLNLANETDGSFSVWAVDTDWQEQNVSWNTINMQTENKVKVATFFPNRAGEHVINLNQDGVALVQSWVTGEDNFGFAVVSDESEEKVKIYSSESDDVDKRPTLSLGYRVQ